MRKVYSPAAMILITATMSENTSTILVSSQVKTLFNCSIQERK